MARFQITGPDGHSYEITAPEGASESDVLSFARKNYQARPKTADDLPKDSEGRNIRATTAPPPSGLDQQAIFEAREKLRAELKAKGIKPESDPRYIDLSRDMARSVQERDRDAADMVGGGVAAKGALALGKTAGTATAGAVTKALPKAADYLFDHAFSHLTGVPGVGHLLKLYGKNAIKNKLVPEVEKEAAKEVDIVRHPKVDLSGGNFEAGAPGYNEAIAAAPKPGAKYVPGEPDDALSRILSFFKPEPGPKPPFEYPPEWGPKPSEIPRP